MTALVVLTSGFYADSGKVKFCGSPGEGTCQSCHNSNAVNSSILTVWWTGSYWPSSYSPGDILTMKVFVNCINSNVAGFAVEILDSSGNDAGRILVTDTQSTELKIAYVGNTKRTTIVHKTGYIPSTLYFGVAVEYGFSWVAPNHDVGNVTVYTSVVSANGDGTPANDFTCTMSINLAYSPPIINSISEVQSVTDAPQYKFYDLQGKQVANSYSELSLLPKAIYIADSSGVRKKIMN